MPVKHRGAVPPLEPEETEKLDGPKVVATFREKLIESLIEHMNASQPQAIFNSIVADVKKERESITMQLLGIDSRYGKYEFDHCNGRMSALDTKTMVMLGDALDEIIKEEVAKVVSDAKTNNKHPIRVAVRAELKSRLGAYSMRNYIEKAASDLYQNVVDEEVKRLKDSISKG